MSTPIGHLLVGATAGSLLGSSGSDRRALAVAGFCGAAPDLDFLPGILLGDPARFHHGISHSLLLALLAGLAAYLLASQQRYRWAGIVSLAYASHLALDYLTADPSIPVGIPLFWPVSDAYVLSPITPLPRVIHTAASPINVHNFAVGLSEIVVFGSALVLVRAVVARRRAARSGPMDSVDPGSRSPVGKRT